MSIYRSVSPAYRFMVEAEVRKDATAREVLDHLFGTYDECSDYAIYRRKDYKDKSTLLQRFNMLWVVPVFYLVSPVQWLFSGRVGVSSHTKLGKFIHKITGI